MFKPGTKVRVIKSCALVLGTVAEVRTMWGADSVMLTVGGQATCFVPPDCLEHAGRSAKLSGFED